MEASREAEASTSGNGGHEAMSINSFAERWDRREKVLLAAPHAVSLAPLEAELRRRGADVITATDIEGAADAVRCGDLDAVYLTARDSPDATSLLVNLVAGQARGARVMLVVEAASAGRYAELLTLVEESMTFALSPARMADAAGIGFRRQAAFG